MLRIFGKCPKSFTRVFLDVANDQDGAEKIIDEKLKKELPGWTFYIQGE